MMKRIMIFLMMSITSFCLNAQTGNESLGYNALNSISTGSNNIGIGINAGLNNTTGSANVFLGQNSGLDNEDGENNTMVGIASGRANTGSDNTCVGFRSGYENMTGNSNTYIGLGSGRNNARGSNNVALGYRAGQSSEGNNNIFLGYQAGFNETGSNKLYIDNSETNEPLIYGDFSSDKLTVNGSLGVGEQIPIGETVPPIKLYVDGRFAQQFEGNIGGFTGNDLWSSLGKSFSPANNIPQVYGMINVWGNRSLISGVKNGQHGVVSWGGPAARLDFDYLDENANNETYISITSNGNVGIGTVNPGNKLSVSGDISSTRIFTTSDSRYKEDIQIIEGALAKIKDLKGVSYEYKKEEINNIDFTNKPGRQCGLIAQEVEKVLPECVKKDEAGYYTVNYDGIIPVLIEGMKEQQENISKQNEIIETQQESMAEMKAQINELTTLLKSTAPKLGESEAIGVEQSVVLKQNSPNPTSQITNIEYEIPATIKNASLIISDMAGRQIANYSVSGMGNIQFDTKSLANGTYTYAVFANGQNMLSRKMVVQH